MDIDKGLLLSALAFGAIFVGIAGDFTPHQESSFTAEIQEDAATPPATTGLSNGRDNSMPDRVVASRQQPANLGIGLLTEEEAFGYNPDYPEFSMRMDEVIARRDGQPVDVAAIKAALQQTSAWQDDDSVAEELDLEPEERFDGRVFIRFNPMKLESLVAGDSMEIPLTQLQRTFTFMVDSVEVHDNESVSWNGHLTELDEDNQVSFTQGNTLTYAGITTPAGLFVLQTDSGKGWIAEASSLFKGECKSLPVSITHTGQSAAHQQGSDEAIQQEFTSLN
jgi:hypothetical protein